MKLAECSLSPTRVINRLPVNCSQVFKESMLIFSSKGAFHYKYVLFNWYKGLVYMKNCKVVRQVGDKNTLIRFYQGFVIICEDIINYGCRMRSYSGGPVQKRLWVITMLHSIIKTIKVQLLIPLPRAMTLPGSRNMYNVFVPRFLIPTATSLWTLKNAHEL